MPIGPGLRARASRGPDDLGHLLSGLRAECVYRKCLLTGRARNLLLFFFFSFPKTGNLLLIFFLFPRISHISGLLPGTESRCLTSTINPDPFSSWTLGECRKLIIITRKERKFELTRSFFSGLVLSCNPFKFGCFSTTATGFMMTTVQRYFAALCCCSTLPPF